VTGKKGAVQTEISARKTTNVLTQKEFFLKAKKKGGSIAKRWRVSSVGIASVVKLAVAAVALIKRVGNLCYQE
jgi:hypothetical protein